MRTPIRTATGCAVALALAAGALSGCDHAAKEIERGVETALGVPQPERLDGRETLDVYCYKGLGYGPAAPVTCHRAPLGKDEDNRLQGSLYHNKVAY